METTTNTENTYFISGTKDYVEGWITVKPASELVEDEHDGILDYLQRGELEGLIADGCMVAIGKACAQRYDNSGELRPCPMYDGRWIAWSDGFWITYNGDPVYYDVPIPIDGTADEICEAIALAIGAECETAGKQEK